MWNFKPSAQHCTFLCDVSSRTLASNFSDFEMHEYVLYRYGTLQFNGVMVTCGVRDNTDDEALDVTEVTTVLVFLTLCRPLQKTRTLLCPVQEARSTALFLQIMVNAF